MIWDDINKFIKHIFRPNVVLRKNPDQYDYEGKIHPVSGVRIWPGGRCAAYVFLNAGYLTYVVRKGYYCRVHAHVAELFIPNPGNKPVVNHIDGNKRNPHADNLEWVTYSENTKHAYALGLIKRRTKNSTHNENNNSR